VVLFAAPGLAAAQGKINRFSGAFKVQIGLDQSGEPAYADCGEMNLYKVAGGGREWRLDNTCDELIDVLLPVIQPTPAPTGGPITPTPTPGPGPTGSGDCPDGFFSKVSNSQWALNNIILTEAKDHVWCADLPASTRPFFEVKTVNKGNSSCSDVEMTVISPLGTQYFSNGSQPGVPPFVSAGRWRVKMHLNHGCSRYDVNISYY
jgi:hypothetical protein